MQNVVRVWSGLEPRRQVAALLALAVMVVAVVWLARIATQPRLSLLYAGLEPSAAGEVVSALDQQGAAYEVRGDAIYASAADRDALRMALAGQGLPANGSAGYELLDSLSGFGTTSQMFDAAYWRAKEGELARTIVASPQVRAARVHISNPSSDPFRRDTAASASVFVTPAGASLGPDQAEALKYLVASAVSGLDPDGVSVIDSASGTVIGTEAGQRLPIADAERAAALQRSVERLVEARVGRGRAFVEVSIEPETDREILTERRLDPEGRVAISSETEERTSSSRGQTGGEVTVASNLPDGDANGAAGESRSEDSESRERTNFEVSETQREVLREPGGIRRLTVAVLVDGTHQVQPDGTRQWVPRPEEELEDLRQLVASAVGFDAARGDEITIKSLELEALPSGEEATAAPRALPVDPMVLAQLGLLGAVALALGIFVLRPILTGAAAPAPGLPAPDAPAAPDIAPPPLTGEIDDGAFGGPALNTVGDFDMDFGAGNDLPALAGTDQDPVNRLRSLIEERQDETMEILRGWMSEPRERAG